MSFRKRRPIRIRTPFLSTLVFLSIAACGTQGPAPNGSDDLVNATRYDHGVINGGGEVPEGNVTPGEANPGVPGTPGGLPDDRTPLEEPNGPIDPKGAEAAGQVAQRYGGLLEQRKFAEARKLWSNGGDASGMTQAQFVAAYEKYATIHSEVGRPADMEGAAGSIYITVPFRLYGTLKSGGGFNLVGPLTLRRVNDVPGSTEEQRRWHIADSDLKPRP
jgi:hypothetical protein